MCIHIDVFYAIYLLMCAYEACVKYEIIQLLLRVSSHGAFYGQLFQEL